ncbi:MAG: DUF2029 domain-containing protein [Terrimicrobiaceae bacterium]
MMRTPSVNPWTTPAVWGASALIIAGALLSAPHGHLHALGTVPWFLAGSALMLVGYFLALRVSPIPVSLVAAIAVLSRLVLLFQVPGDDIYRYIWEGRILLAGWNPYIHPPEDGSLSFLRDGVWDSVQHKGFTAIYPPLTEWLFAGLGAISSSPLFFKLAFLFADLGTAWLLSRKFGASRSLLYAWNPLVIYSFSGGGHYDSIFVLAMVLGWLAWLEGGKIRSAAWLGVAVAIKWLALPLLAWVGWQIFIEAWKTRRARSLVWAGIAAILPLMASYAAVGLWTGEWTLQLYPAKFSQYARSAEFLPAFVGWLWEQSKYHNHWFLIPLALGWAAVILRSCEFARSAEWLFFLSFILTPMLHAWYFTWIIPFAVLTRNRGTLAVTASGFLYFLLYHHVEIPGGRWVLSPLETVALWLPFAAGFLWSALRPPPSHYSK